MNANLERIQPILRKGIMLFTQFQADTGSVTTYLSIFIHPVNNNDDDTSNEEVRKMSLTPGDQMRRSYRPMLLSTQDLFQPRHE